MGLEHKKDKQKTPAELAASQTSGEPETGEREKTEPEKKPSTSRAARKPAPAKAKAEKTAKRPASKKTPAADTAEEKSKPVAEKKPADKKPAAEKKPARTRGARRAPARRRGAPEPPRSAPSRPVVRARAKYVRSSARKARLVIDHIRGKSVQDARALLQHTPRAVARDIEKLLASAVANAENNHELVGDDLYVKEAYADEGPTLKRFRPRALGRATRIRKRTSHLTLTLTPKNGD